MSFEIDSNVPIPSPQATGRHSRYPFREMKIGDSFLVPNEHDSVRVRSSASYFGIRNKEYRFIVRKDTGGVRVWRVPLKTLNQDGQY